MPRKEIMVCIFLMLLTVFSGGLYFYGEYRVKGKAEQVAEKKSDGMVPVEQAFDYEKVLKKKYDNLEFGKDFALKPVKEIHSDLVKLGGANPEQKRIPEVFQTILKTHGLQKSYDEKKIVWKEEQYAPPCTSYYDKNLEIGVAYDGGGYFGYHLKEDEMDMEEEMKESYFLLKSHGGKSWKLSEGTLSEGELKTLVEKESRLYAEKLGFSINVIPARTVLYEVEQGESRLSVDFQMLYDGVPLVDIHPADEHSVVAEDYVELLTGNCALNGNKQENIFKFYVNCGIGHIEPWKKGKRIPRIFSFSEATDRVNQMLSSYRRYPVQYAALEYMAIPSERFRQEHEWEIDEQGEEEEKKDANEEWDLKLVPCFAFYFDADIDQQEVAAYVNALTGEVSFICNQ